MNQPIAYNYMNAADRFRFSWRLLARAKKQGYGEMWRVWFTEQPTLYLGPTKQLDGLSLYRMALQKLQVDPVIANDRGRTILIVSHCY